MAAPKLELGSSYTEVHTQGKIGDPRTLEKQGRQSITENANL